MRTVIFGALVLLTTAAAALPEAVAQGGGAGGNQGGGGAGGQGGGNFGGIEINADGLVRQAGTVKASAKELRAELLRNSRELPSDVNRVSARRYISLAALDTELHRRTTDGSELPPEVLSLAGLTQIDLIAITDDGRDVVLAGPAEGFAAGRDGRVVGLDSGRPVLRLDDLLVALRLTGDQITIGCSFDPDPDRLLKARRALQQQTVASSRAAAERGFEAVADIMGNWTVRVLGVPENSRMAVAMVEADFLLKRLTTGTEKSGVRGFRSHLAMMQPGDDVMRRWWFSALDDCVRRNSDGTVFLIDGQRLRVSAREQLVDDNGNRRDSEVSNPGIEEYARQFTDRIPQLADNFPALAHLQNLVDIMVAAAVIRSGQDRGLLSWQPAALMDADLLKTEQYNVPRETPSIAVSRSGGSRTVIGLVAGGVVIHPARLRDQAQTVELQPDRELNNAHHTWWWDRDPAVP